MLEDEKVVRKAEAAFDNSRQENATLNCIGTVFGSLRVQPNRLVGAVTVDES